MVEIIFCYYVFEYWIFCTVIDLQISKTLKYAEKRRQREMEVPVW